MRAVAAARTERLLDFRGVFSVWLRHWRIYIRSWVVNCLAPISEPVLYLLAFGYGLQPFVNNFQSYGAGMTYREFIAPGMVATGVLFQASAEGAYGTYIRIHFQETWRTMLTGPLHFNDVFTADLLWAATRGFVAGVATGLVAICFGIFSVTQLFLMLPAIIFGSIMSAAFGMCCAALVKRIDQMNIPTFLIVMPMFSLCGTFFPREVLPGGLRTFAELLPLSPLVDLVRYPGMPIPDLILNYVCLFVWMVLFITVAYRNLHKKLFR